MGNKKKQKDVHVVSGNEVMNASPEAPAGMIITDMTSIERTRMARDAYRYSVQQHMADVKLFMSDLNKIKSVVPYEDEMAREWVRDRIKYWDIRLGDLRVPED